MRTIPRILAIVSFVLLHLLSGFVAKSQSFTTIKKILNGGSNELLPGASITVQDSVFFNTALTGKLDGDYPLTNAIALKINEYSPVFLATPFTVTADLEVTYVGSDKVQRIFQKQLTMQYDTGKAYTNRSSFIFSKAHLVTVKILNISSTNPGALAAVMLENEMMVRPTYKLDRIADVPGNIGIGALEGPDSDEATVTWNYVLGADQYDLEWAYIDSSVIASGRYGNPIDYDNLFRNNCTRVSINSNSYRIPLLYDNGGLLYVRVRAVSVKGSNKRFETLWSTNGGTIATLSYPGHHRNLNWQSSISFAEEGKRKAVVNYFDGSMMSRQVVTKDNTTNTTVVSETLYDKQGRPAIQILPTPTLNNIIKYTSRLNTGINGQEYDKSVYDTVITPRDIIDAAAPPLGTNSGAAQYYSPQNPKVNEGLNAFLPDAAGFPFSETVYTADNTGRISKQGGVGEHFRVNGAHATRYYYGNPSQQELDRLFGTEAGDASHYFKSMVQDANGQMSVTYTDLHGRTVATALAGIDVGSQLKSLPTNMPRMLVDTLSGVKNTQVKDLVLTTRKSLLVESDGVYFFKYSITPPVLTLQDCNHNNISYSSKYDLEIKITDDVQNLLLGGSPFLIKRAIDGPYTDTFTLYLRRGNYEISKNLQVSEAEMNNYRDNIFLSGSVCISKEAIIQQQRTLINNNSCAPTCAGCLAELGSLTVFNTVYMNRAGLEPADSVNYRAEILTAYNKQLDFCKSLCNNVPYQDVLRKAMLQDLTPPGGQYANFSDSVKDKYSIFYAPETTNTNPIYKFPSIIYLNEDGKPDLVFDEYTQKMVKPQELTPRQFIAKFKPSWAEQLLPYHPEYCRWQYYAKFNSSREWADKIRLVDTYQEALFKGYLNPTDNVNRRAYYGSPSVEYKDPYASLNTGNLDGALANYKGSGYNIWTMAASSVMCPSGAGCANTYNVNNVFAQVNGACAGDQNAIWTAFREMYLASRDALIDADIQSFSCSAPTITELIAAGKQSHFISANDGLKSGNLDGVLNIKTEAEANAYKNSQSTTVTNSICDGYVDTWRQKLSPCKYSDADWAVLKAQLLAICKAGTDANHPTGASSVPASSGLTDTSFEAVIRKFNAQHYDATRPEGCPVMITTPAPYYAQNAAITKATNTKPEPCECEKITAIKLEYEIARYSGESFSQYLSRTRNTNITQTQLDALINACSGASSCMYTEQPLQIPAVFQCYNAPPCTNCIVVKSLYDNFKLTYPGIVPEATAEDSLKLSMNELFANYMNSRTGLGLQAVDYLRFVDNCNTTSYNDSVYSKGGFSSATVSYNYTTTVRDARPTKDGGFVFVGSMMVFNKDIPFILKTDRNGNPSWQELLDADGATSGGFFWRVMVTSDSNIVAYGVQRGSGVEIDGAFTNGAGMVVKYSPTGTRIWDRAMNGGSDGTVNAELIREMVELSNGNYGFIGDYNHLGRQQWMAGVMQKDGTLVWRKTVIGWNNACLTIKMLEDNDTMVVAGVFIDTNQLFTPHILRWNKLTGVLLGGSFKLRSSNYKSDPVSLTRLGPGNYRIGVIQSQSNGTTDGPLAFVDFTSAGVIQRESILSTLDERTFGWVQGYDGSTYSANNVPSSISPSSAYIFSFTNAGTMAWAKKYSGQNAYLRWAGIVGNKAIALGENSAKPTIYWYNAGTAVNCETALTFTPTSGSRFSTLPITVTDRSLLGVGLYGSMHLRPATITSTYSNVPCGTEGSTEDIHIYTGPILCGRSQPTFELEKKDTINNCSDSSFFISNTATEIYTAKVDSVKNDFVSRYLNNSLKAAANEEFTVAHQQSEYHYTLYYYDQAGNLTMTVPPAGVDLDTTTDWLNRVSAARLAGGGLVPAHRQVTRYRYNSLNQVVDQISPDGGRSHFWYDRLGRLVASQNAKQREGSAYSYTRYDYLGRITEVGEITSSVAMTNEISRNEADLAQWMANAGGTRTAITKTSYDQAYPGTAGSPQLITQRNLRNRVSMVTYLDNAADMDIYQYGTIYSYDIHGNVDTLLQDFRGSNFGATFNRFKKIAYDYDLISGKVNKVAYQPGKVDAFYHRYIYDAENRITDVETSKDDFHWEKDASYQYYKHGPLSRMELGQQKVQGVDYAYTLQGWLKGVNGSSGNASGDMGADGKTGAISAKDAFSYSLHYFGDNDYNAIGQADKFAKGTGGVASLYKPLYNGNISAMGVNIPSLGEPLLYNYGYDVLNRISSMTAAKGLNTSLNLWQPTAINDFREEVSYDANGNIQTYHRDGNTMVPGNQLQMDELTYFYKNDGSNKLDYIGDAVPDANYVSDIDSQQPSNYQYDAIGNLIKDVAGGIENIEWTVYGKIKTITKSDGTLITYNYDPSGNRISKLVKKPGSNVAIGTYYVRDASGNVMSVYSNGDAAINNGDMTQIESHLYGSNRLGLIRQRINVQSRLEPDTTFLEGAGPGIIDIFTRGNKVFELNNHLGNVLATVSDRKRPISTDGSTVERYEPIVLTANDYYPFGMLMPGRGGGLDDGGNWHVDRGGAVPADLSVNSRTNNQPAVYNATNSITFEPGFATGENDAFEAFLVAAGGNDGGNGTGGAGSSLSGGYRYGFNGKENDNEVKGEGNQQDYGMRVYDPRIGKFLSVDPLTKKYPYYTPYSFAGNKPIAFIDRDGEEEGIDNILRRREEAYLSNQMSEDKYREHVRAMGINGVIGGAIVVDAFLTKGKVSEFLLFSQMAGAFNHNRAKTAEGRREQEAESRNIFLGAAVGWGVGKILGSAIRIGWEAAAEVKYLFRGTSEGFEGLSSLQRLGLTPTSSDPVVATVFATNAENYGKGVLQVALPKNLQGVEFTSNVLSEMEREIAVGIKPAEFTSKVTLTITSTEARGILGDMGIKLPSKVKLDELSNVLRETPRLNAAQIDEFYKRASQLKKP